MTTMHEHRREVLEENFGDLEQAELSEFLGDVIEQFQADLQAVTLGGKDEAAAALHRIAGSAPSMGCMTLGELARAAMTAPQPDQQPIVMAVEAALQWLQAMRHESNLRPERGSL